MLQVVKTLLIMWVIALLKFHFQWFENHHHHINWFRPKTHQGLNINHLKCFTLNYSNILPAAPTDRGPEGTVGELSPAALWLKQTQAGAGAPAENGFGKRAGHPNRLHLSGELLVFVHSVCSCIALHVILLWWEILL